MKPEKLSSVVFFSCILMAGSACGPQNKPIYETSGQYIINGQQVEPGEHLETVVVENHQEYSLCSGTLIAPRVILTAAHCIVDEDKEAPGPENFTIDFGDIWDNYDNIEVSQVLVHPKYVRILLGDHSSSLANDVALLRLADSAPDNVKPIPTLPKSLKITSDDVGASIEFVGFGIDGTTGKFGIKRKIEKEIAKVCTSYLGCLWNLVYWAAPNSICVINKTGGTCSGDSGGPALITRDNQTYVAGVASYGGDSECKTFGCSTKVDHLEDFIEDFLLADNGYGCSNNDECKSGICAQGVCCDTPCSDTCMACNLPGFSGKCLTVPDGYECPDGDLCNGIETCQAGICNLGEPTVCDDNESCTEDSCQPENGCVFTPIANNTSCSNGDICDGQETCQNGVCTQGQQLDCDDEDTCTSDHCDPVSGCKYTSISNCYSQCSECKECQDCLNGACIDTDQCSDNHSGCNQTGSSTDNLAGLLLVLIMWFRRKLFAI